jgi:hypothetical protein
MSDDGADDGPIDSPQDRVGCIKYAFRMSGCIAALYITMFLAIIIAAILSLFFFR